MINFVLFNKQQSKTIAIGDVRGGAVRDGVVAGAGESGDCSAGWAVVEAAAAQPAPSHLPHIQHSQAIHHHPAGL